MPPARCCTPTTRSRTPTSASTASRWIRRRAWLLMLHKPVGYTCSTKDPGRIVYDLLPPRFRLRSPLLSTVGRLDRDTSGLLLLTDDGALLHRIVSPKSQLAKVYEATLAQDLRGDEAAVFASGTLHAGIGERRRWRRRSWKSSTPRHARLTLTEGRYHQVRRMFAAVGNHVEALHRSRIGGLELGDLPPGEWRALDGRAICEAPVRRELAEARQSRYADSYAAACASRRRPAARSVSMLRSTIASGSGNAATARATLSSRSRCRVGYGERLVKFSTSSGALPANW